MIVYVVPAELQGLGQFFTMCLCTVPHLVKSTAEHQECSMSVLTWLTELFDFHFGSVSNRSSNG